MRHGIRTTIFMFSLFSLVLGAAVSFVCAKLTDPGMSEADIKRAWMEFEKGKDGAWPKGTYPFMDCFEKAAVEHGVPLPLLLAVARGESNFDPKAASNKECYGIMQIQWPGTAKDVGITRKANLFDPCTNINGGAKYLSWLLKRFGGDVYLAVAAYNYGPNAVAPGKVPEGARWYAAYIYRHLDYVKTVTFEKEGRLLILEFTFYNSALGALNAWQKQIAGVPFEIFKSNKYTYDVYIIYKTTAERDNYARRFMKSTGIEPLEIKKSKGAGS